MKGELDLTDARKRFGDAEGLMTLTRTQRRLMGHGLDLPWTDVAVSFTDASRVHWQAFTGLDALVMPSFTLQCLEEVEHLRDVLADLQNDSNAYRAGVERGRLESIAVLRAMNDEGWPIRAIDIALARLEALPR